MAILNDCEVYSDFACELEKWKQNLLTHVVDDSTCIFQDVTLLDSSTRHCVRHQKPCVP